MSKNKWGLEMAPDTICAIDASTMSIAFAIFNTKAESLDAVGKIYFEGNNGCWPKGQILY